MILLQIKEGNLRQLKTTISSGQNAVFRISWYMWVKPWKFQLELLCCIWANRTLHFFLPAGPVHVVRLQIEERVMHKLMGI
jgi:hypothetical protein